MVRKFAIETYLTKYLLKFRFQSFHNMALNHTSIQTIVKPPTHENIHPSFALFHRHHIIPTANKLSPLSSTTSSTKAKCVLSVHHNLCPFSSCRQCCQTITNVCQTGPNQCAVVGRWKIISFPLYGCSHQDSERCPRASLNMWVSLFFFVRPSTISARSTFRVDFQMINLTRQQKTPRPSFQPANKQKGQKQHQQLQKALFIFKSHHRKERCHVLCPAGMTFCTCVIVGS